jgi:hypothetical protein
VRVLACAPQGTAPQGKEEGAGEVIKLPVQNGDRYGRLTVVSDATDSHLRKFLCRCDCGNNVEVYLSNLRGSVARKPTRSCGCIRIEVTIARNFKHGKTKTPEHNAWVGIRKRCLDPQCKSYPDYGGRGIKISQDWDRFDNFLRDVGLKPTPKHTIERIDTNGHYEKYNCKWATRKEQTRNTRVSRMITLNGETRCLAEWDERFSEAGLCKPGRFRAIVYRKGVDFAYSVITAARSASGSVVA